LIHKGIAVPVSTAVHLAGAIPIKGVTRVEHRHAVHEITNRPQSRERLRGWNGRSPRNTIKRGGIFRHVWKKHRVRRVQIPRSHDMASQTGRADINPTRRTHEANTPHTLRGT